MSYDSYVNELINSCDWRIDKEISKEDAEAFLKVSGNASYVMSHGLTTYDIEKFKNIQAQFEARMSIAVEPMMYDNIQILSNNGHIFYKHAQLETCSYNETGWCYCENANTHFINMGVCSVSGGSWHNVDIKKLKYDKPATRTVWTWGHCGPCGNGGFYVPVRVNGWKLRTDRKFVPFALRININAKRGEYKYFLDRFDHLGYVHAGIKYTKKGIKEYMSQRGLKLGRRMSRGCYEIIGDFTEQQHMSLAEYEADKPENAKEFQITDNGRITHAYMSGDILHYCNCNVEDRFEINDILRD